MPNKLIKQILCLFSAFIVSIFSLTSYADTANDGTITVSTVTAVTGDTVIVNLDISDNPGIMAITVSVTYDSNALVYEKYYNGFLKDYTVADHPDQNLIRFVNCEDRNIRQNGTLISLQFKVKDDASFDLHKISVSYKAGDFCNWNLQKLMPKIVSGGVDVKYNGSNCSHKEFGEWETAAAPSCTENGVDQRSCKKCGHIEIKETPAVGHKFSDEWTVDRAATADILGLMSRHCLNCDEVTDSLTFEFDKIDKLEIKNTEGSIIAPSKNTDKLMNEQHPNSASSDTNENKSDNKPDSKSEIGNSSDVSDNGTPNNLKVLVIFAVVIILLIAAAIILLIISVKKK